MSLAPAIIIGMHRSGTGLLTRILEELGLFTGYYKEENYESTFFMGLNGWMLEQANATWDNPYCFKFVNRSLEGVMCGAVKMAIRNKTREQFLGPVLFSEYANVQDLDIPWGWKDPRNTITLRIWKNVFPDAKIIHVYRNPVDVAVSLRKRELERNLQTQRILETHGLGKLRKKGIKFHFSPRVAILEEGIKLWFDYVNEALSTTCQDSRCLHIKYEELLEKPAEIIAKAAGFIGLNANEGMIEKCCKSINSGRRYAFLKEPELVDTYNGIKKNKLIETLGYGAIPF